MPYAAFFFAPAVVWPGEGEQTNGMEPPFRVKAPHDSARHPLARPRTSGTQHVGQGGIPVRVFDPAERRVVPSHTSVWPARVSHDPLRAANDPLPTSSGPADPTHHPIPAARRARTPALSLVKGTLTNTKITSTNANGAPTAV